MTKRGEDPFVHSLTDLMSGLAVIFLLVALLFIILTATANRDVKKRAEQYNELSKREIAARKSASELEALLRALFAKAASRVTVQRDEKRNPLLIFVLLVTASMRSELTKIAELETPGTSKERELSHDEDWGFLWRAVAWWRLVQISPGRGRRDCLPWRPRFRVRLAAGKDRCSADASTFRESRQS